MFLQQALHLEILLRTGQPAVSTPTFRPGGMEVASGFFKITYQDRPYSNFI